MHYSQLCRYAEDQLEPSQDPVQNVDRAFASFVDGITIVQFSRNKITGDSNKDLTLNVCRFLLFAWNGNQNRASTDTLICFPSQSLCPERCKKLRHNMIRMKLVHVHLLCFS